MCFLFCSGLHTGYCVQCCRVINKIDVLSEKKPSEPLTGGGVCARSCRRGHGCAGPSDRQLGRACLRAQHPSHPPLHVQKKKCMPQPIQKKSMPQPNPTANPSTQHTNHRATQRGADVTRSTVRYMHGQTRDCTTAELD